MADGFVQAPADNTGKKADSEELTVNSITVERIRVSVPNDVPVGGDVLGLILLEMRTTNDLIALAFGLSADLEALRAHPGDD